MTTDTKENTIDVKDLKVSFDTKNTSVVTGVLCAVREELVAQLTLNIFDGSYFDHLVPTGKGSISRDEVSKHLIANVLSIFDTACINQSLKTLKFRMLMDKGVRH